MFSAVLVASKGSLFSQEVGLYQTQVFESKPWSFPKLNQSTSTALLQERKIKFYLNMSKVITQNNIQLELICGFAETYLADIYSAD